MASFPFSPSSPSLLPSSSSSSPPLLPPWPHLTNSKTPRTRPASLSFLSPLHPKNPSSSSPPTHVSLQDFPPQEPPPPSTPNPNSKNSNNTRSLWVNPNSPRAAAAAAARARSGAGRRARLATTAAFLDNCDPAEATLATALAAAFPNPPNEQDAVIVLNNMTNPITAVLALRWFLENVEFNKEVILYNVTIKVLRNRKRWDATEALWDEMLRNGVKPDNATFSTVISCARLCSLPDKAVEWFEKMPEFGCSPDEVTYSVMIDAYGRAGNAKMALNIYDRARAEKWRLDAVICATVIRVHSNCGNFDGALNVFEEMKAVGVKPNLVVYNSVLDAMGRAGRPWVVKTIHRDLINNGEVLNRATCCFLLRAYTKARYGDDAMAVYRLMKDEAMDLDVILFNMLLAMCADIGYIEEAEEIFGDMKASVDSRSRPDSWSYSSMITAYSCTGNVLEAERILNEMVEASFQPNIFVLTSLIQCYGKVGRTDDVVRSFGMLTELGITPDDRFCGCLLNVAAHTQVGELGKVVDCIQRSNAQLGSVVKLLVDESASIEAFREVASKLLSSICDKVRTPYCNCLIDLSVNLNQMEKACVLLDLALKLEIYTNIQSKTPTQWSLHLRGLSVGAALTTLHVWMNDLSTALQNGEELPPVLGIHTGHGKHMYSEKGLASMFESHLKELDAPFHEAPDKAGWFLTTSVAAKSWLEGKKSSELVSV